MAQDHNEESIEIGPEGLFLSLNRQCAPVVDGKIKSLPLHDQLSPDDFERLIARLADPSDGMSVRAFRYGKSGSTQGGIDVMIIDTRSRKCDYFEGKRWSTIKRGDITAWVDKFLGGPHAADARKFVLCTTFNVFEITDLALEWKECSKSLAAKEIEGDLWDGHHIHQLLRHRSAIVSELFGDDVAERYCVPDIHTPADPPTHEFEAQRVVQSGRMLSLQNVSIACELLLPSDDEMSTGAILSFARRDLSGISITISGKELVRWMQWRAHAGPDDERPYAIPMNGDPQRVVLTANSARLVLSHEEIKHLDWVLQTAWHTFYKTAAEQLARYRCGRFMRVNGSKGPFALVSVKRALWHAMLDFANAHDTADGDSSWHIFDGAPGCLKVYTERSTSRFDRGYHAIMYAHDVGGVWLPWEGSVVIGWEIPEYFGLSADVSMRGNWDAEFTHDWLLEEFIPEVLRWSNSSKKGSKNERRFFGWRDVHPPATSTLDISSFASSSAIGLTLRTVPERFDELKQCVGDLQPHFVGRRSSAPIEAALSTAVLTAIDRALTFATMPYEGYLRGVLGLKAEEDLVAAVRGLAKSSTTSKASSAMDFMLRGLLEVMDAAKAAPAGEWRAIASLLQPVLDRYNEDAICDLFTAD